MDESGFHFVLRKVLKFRDNGTSQLTFVYGDSYNGFKFGAESASLKFVSIFKNNTWKEALCT